MTDANRTPQKRLEGRTVLLTRPLSQSSGMTRLLEERGAVVIHCATIEIGSPNSWEEIDRAITAIESYDWIVFTSANGARFFFDRFREATGRVFQQASHQAVCAIGPATAKPVEAAGAAVDLLVRDSRAEGVLRELIERVGGEPALEGLRFLLPGARDAREFLPIELRRRGVVVDTVEAYQTVKPNVDIQSLFRGRRFDAITFTSPSTVSNFAQLAGSALLAVVREDTLAACIGPITTAAAVEHGFKRIVQADESHARALVEAIARSLAAED